MNSRRFAQLWIIGICLVLLPFDRPVIAQETRESWRADVSKPMIFVGVSRCSISVSVSGCTTIILNCRFDPFRCGGGDNGGDIVGEAMQGEVTTKIKDSPSECTTNVPGKSCQDLMDLAISNTNNNNNNGDGDGPGTSGPSSGGSTPPKLTLAVPKVASVVPPYSVKGTTHEAVNKAIHATIKNPSTGEFVSALTYAHYSFRYESELLAGGQGHRLTAVDASLNITTQMPNWIDFDKAPKCLQDNWNKLIGGLTIHEQGHVDRYQFYEEYVKRELDKLPPKFNLLSDVSDAVNAALAQALLQVVADKQKPYEDETQEGLTQGAIFNPCPP